LEQLEHSVWHGFSEGAPNVAGIELDPWGGETNRSWNSFYQPHRYTSLERGWTGDESLFRRHHVWFSRFAHPDPYDGSYNSTDPQSFNRYAYVQNDPVNFVDPTGLEWMCVTGDNGERFCFDNTDPKQTVQIYANYGGRGGGGGGGDLFGGNASIESGVEGGWDGGGGGILPLNSSGGQSHPLLPTIKQKICGVIPSGRTVGASGALGLLGGPTGGGEVVINYNSGQSSAFAFGGAQVGWNGGASGSVFTGFVYGLNGNNILDNSTPIC
jgi:RHS repeat-associated protein